MQNLNFSNLSGLTEISNEELLKIEGGSFWSDVAYVAGVIVHGFVVFGTEGGQSAGLCVK